MHSTATSPLSIPATLDSLTAKPTPWFPFFSYVPPSAPEKNQNTPRRRASALSIGPHLRQSYDITTCVFASFHYHLCVAYAVRALESKCSNVVRTHDEFPCARPSPCICANFLGSPSNPLASPPLLPTLRFPPFHPPFFSDRVFPPLRLPSHSPVLA